MPTPDRSVPLPREASLAIGIIVLHLLVIIPHGAAHGHFEIPTALWQKIFIDAVIVAAPLVAGGLLVARRLRAGAWLLLVSMAGALLFGVVFHFLLLGPDHVSSVDMHAWGFLFQATAFLLAVTEAWGVSVSIRLVRLASRAQA